MPTWIALALVTALAQEPAPRVELRVVGPDGTPVRDAELRFACEDEHGGAIRAPEVRGGFRQGLRLDDPPLASQVGLLLRDHEFGTVLSLDWPRDRGLLVEARQGDSWGYAWFPRDWRATTGRDHLAGQPLEIEIAPDWNLVVEVQDASGRPVQDALVRLARGEKGSRGLSTNRSPVVFEHLGFELRHDRSAATIRVDGLFAAPVEARVEPGRRPEGPLVLRLPPTGSVEFVLQDPDGLPLEREWSVILGRAGREPRSGGYSRDGRILFPLVALGETLEVRLPGRIEDEPETFAGPTWAGERVVRTLLTPRRPPEPALTTPALAVPTGSFHGRLLLDEGVPTSALEVALVDPLERQGRLTLNLQRTGSFAADDLPVGRYRLEITTHGLVTVPEHERPYLHRAELELAAGVDLELPLLDLRGKLFLHRVHFGGESPADKECVALFGPRTWPTSQRGYLRLPAGAPLLVSAWPELDLELFVPGYRRIALADLGAERTVALEPGLPVALSLAGVPVPAAPVRLAAVLVPEGSARPAIDWKAPTFEPARPLETTAYAPGPNRVLWLLTRGGRGQMRETERPMLVEVRDLGMRQTFTLELAPEELAGWLAEF